MVSSEHWSALHGGGAALRLSTSVFFRDGTLQTWITGATNGSHSVKDSNEEPEASGMIGMFFRGGELMKAITF